jgi:hypothetical protein
MAGLGANDKAVLLDKEMAAFHVAIAAKFCSLKDGKFHTSEEICDNNVNKQLNIAGNDICRHISTT